MSIWKTINPNDVANESIIVHKEYDINISGSFGNDGIKIQRYQSGSEGLTVKPTNTPDYLWTSNRVNFYLTGSTFDLEDTSSTDGRPLDYGSKAFTLGSFDSVNPQYLTKFYTTGSTLSISQYYWGDSIKRGSFKLIDNTHPSGSITIQDDGYGNLYAPSASISSSGDTAISSSDNYVGNIFYNLGIVNITETGSYSHTPSSASVIVATAVAGIISHSHEISISSSMKTTPSETFIFNSGSITGSDDTNRFYVTSASGHSQISESLFVSFLSMSKKINEQFNLDSPSGSYISSSVDYLSAGKVKLELTNDRRPNIPMFSYDNEPPLTGSNNNKYTISGFGGGTARLSYLDVGRAHYAEVVTYSCSFASTQQITTREYLLKVKKGDFNYTNNLTARKFGPHQNTLSSQSLFDSPYLKDDLLSGSISGSWGPCMTTIGFYQPLPDGTFDSRPVMVARYPQPIRMRKDVDLIFKIRLDF